MAMELGPARALYWLQGVFLKHCGSYSQRLPSSAFGFILLCKAGPKIRKSGLAWLLAQLSCGREKCEKSAVRFKRASRSRWVLCVLVRCVSGFVLLSCV